MAEPAVLQRSAVARENTWNAESVFASDAAWEEEYKRVEQSLPHLEQLKGRLAEGPTVLADAFEAVDTLTRAIGKIFTYVGMLQASDQLNQAATAMYGRALTLYSRTSAAGAFLNPEIIAIGQDTLRGWLQSEPRLAHYAHAVDDLFRQQAHVRSAEVEEVLGIVSDPFGTVYNTFQMLSNADFTFRPARSSVGNEIPVSQSTIDALRGDADRETRRTAWESYTDTHLAYKNTLANNLIVQVKQDVVLSRIRRHPSALEGALFPANIPPQVFYNLIDTYKSHLGTWHRYWNLRRRALGYDKLHTYDIAAPLATPQTITYKEAVDMICAGMRPLGDEYVDTLRRGCLEQRWVDIYPNIGKTSGAFSSGAPDTYPFIMMNFVNDPESMSTLAHELGHSMHSYLTWKNQPTIYGNYSIFVAEVASNFNQAMVRAYLFNNNPDPAFQIAIIEEAMSNFGRYFFIMPTLARFELEMHERIERGDNPTADEMIALQADLIVDVYGGEMEVDRQRDGILWATFPHLYSNFYVFQYATGISAAHALSQRVLSGEPHAADDYLNFLKAGNSLYPLDALKRSGVDMTSPEPVEKTFAILDGMLDRLEKLVTSLPSKQ